ncbi:MAG: DUF3341 domain-containing protein [Bacteroidia bacterium]|nr:DUF3341 domain-containing protein [Bacteroidia bacterium]
MANKNERFIYGVFDDDEKMLNAVKTLRAKGLKVKDAFSPFPIHGLDKALGLKRTRISICSFLFGMTGTCLALIMIYYMNIFDWPMDIGGKPSFAFYKNLPAYIPVTFESTVLLAAHGMVITFYLRSKLLPGVEPHVPDLRMHDDRFVVKMPVTDDNESGVRSALQEVGVEEIKA